MVASYLLSTAFDVLESEGDAEGLRALRRIMVLYFVAHKPNKLDSKYASFTLNDLVVELSQSERTRKGSHQLIKCKLWVFDSNAWVSSLPYPYLGLLYLLFALVILCI